jgi:hypothetical protein
MITKNVLSQKEIDLIQDTIAHSPKNRQEIYGRYMYHDVVWEKGNFFVNTIEKKVIELTGKPYQLSGFVVCDYTAEAGKPNLPPHFDGDQTDLIMTYQISSNRTWGVGVDLNVYDLEDNDGVIFHPNESIHWRPHAEFKDGELVRVMFVRFRLPIESDYSHLRLSQDDPIFSEVRAFRDSL